MTLEIKNNKHGGIMKTRLFLALILTFAFLQAEDQVTIYNENFSLIRSSLTLDLKKGLQSYYMDNIPSTIEANSVIIKPLKTGFEVFSQNYEYDLANSDKILQKYIGKEIVVITKSDDKFRGTLQFNDHQSVGIIESTSKKLNLIRVEEIRNFNLAELPDNFFLKPTLHWRLNTKQAGSYPLDLSYICKGMGWNVTYNTVWNDKENILEINSWVTITNNTGKTFKDIKLKLVAGDVQKVQEFRQKRHIKEYGLSLDGLAGSSAPEFEEKAFHDFHLYTLSDKVSINNKQTKQLRLYPTASVRAESKYEYQTYEEKISSMIEFTNSKKSGLGLPLPKGIIKIYKLDETDNNLEFIGEDRINHTAIKEEVKLTTGFAFDIIGETKVVLQRKISKNIHEKDMSVTLKNRSSDSKKIVIVHHLSGFWSIFNENETYEKKDANKIEFEVTLKADSTYEVTWTERIEY